jgi:phosphinothricin acetyltransferase
VYVAPDLQRRGAGRALMLEVIRACQSRGSKRMLALIGDSQNHASVGLHGSLGFELAGTLKSVGFKFGRWLDVVIMQRALDAFDSE